MTPRARWVRTGGVVAIWTAGYLAGMARYGNAWQIAVTAVLSVGVLAATVAAPEETR